MKDHPSASIRRSRQRGVTLIIALIMIMAMSLLAVFAVRSGSANLLIVNNTQSRQAAFAAAQAAIERTISSPAFVADPAAVAAAPIPVDVDGDGVADMTAILQPAPACFRWKAVKMNALDPSVAADLPCLRSSQAGQSGRETVGGTSDGDSLCADSDWNVRAVVADVATGANVAINQGVTIRGLITNVATACP